MQLNNDLKPEQLSPWWKHTVVLIMAFGFTILIWRSIQTYSDAPPIPLRAVTTNNETVFTRDDIVGGQNVFLKYGLRLSEQRGTSLYRCRSLRSV